MFQRQHFQLRPRPENPKLKAASQDFEKEDRPDNYPLMTFKKNTSSRPVVNCNKVQGAPKITNRKESLNKIRNGYVELYSKMQYMLNISMEALFLAIDIFDKYLSRKGEDMELREISEIALACFMIAIKYEQVYPPSLQTIQMRMKIDIQFQIHVRNQMKIMQLLNYNLIMISPFCYFQDFWCEMSLEKRSYAYLYLELAALTPSIKHVYTWGQIIEAVKIFYQPFSHIQESAIPEHVMDCYKKLSIERGKILESHHMVYAKYSDPRYHCVAKKPYFIGGNL